MAGVRKQSTRQAKVPNMRLPLTRALVATISAALIGVATLLIPLSPAQAAARSYDDSLAAVSCVGPSYCVAVGTYQDANVPYPLAEEWNGHKWTVMAGEPGQAFMSGVSCVAVGNCWATANYGGEPSIQHLVGTTWVGGGVEPAVTGFLYGISCVATMCVAGGDEYAQGAYNAVIVQGNGQTWSYTSWSQSYPVPSSGFAGASCSTAAACMVVGNTDSLATPPPDTTYEPEALTGSWGGSAWAIGQLGGAGPLSGVSCDSPSDCMAVGGGSIEHWTGSAWMDVSTYPLESLNAVSCVTSTDCASVGSGSDIGSWNGTAWSAIQGPNPKRSKSSTLTGVSCISASNCMAVGSDTKKSSEQINLAERWNGTKWSIVPTPNR